MRPWQKYILGEIAESDFLDSIETVEDVTSKEKIVGRIIKADVINYRWMGRVKNGVYGKEPPGFYGDLKSIYEKMEFKDLVLLLKIKDIILNQR